jgi:hypothetical protein
MKKSIGGFVVCLLGLAACNVEHYDDCKDDSFDFEGDFGGSVGHSRAGASGTGGKTSGDSGAATGGGTTAGSGATGGSAPDGAGGEAGGSSGSGPVVVPPQHCEQESDCEPGFNCDLEQQQCLPSDEETCAELKTEAACTHRSDCTPIYAGTNCSCGQDCKCRGGEPGCVCETFGFFGCS